ncbi:MAG: hypothetical protein JNN17_17120 [Verrucomicrobiaceae bacterium]|nr:hypothetical protein [Verrucomicrobiaceae bacterium]
MNTDPIVQEVREARADIAAEFGYDLSKYLAWIREQTRLRKEGVGKPKISRKPADAGKFRTVKKRPARAVALAH